MDRSLSKTIGLAAMTAIITVFVVRADGGATTGEAAGTLAADSAARDSLVTPRWISDANVLAIVGTMSAKQVAAADIELSAWRSDTVRALALALRGEHVAMQRGVDSLAASLGLTRVPSALNEEVSLAFQAQVDSLAGASGAALDRAYVQEQINSHRLMASYLDQLREVAREPAVRGWVEVADAKVAAQLSRLTTQQSAFAVADSITADSLAQRRARRTSQPTQR